MKNNLLMMMFLAAANLYAADLPPLNGMVQAVAVDGEVVYAATRANQDDLKTNLMRYEGGRWSALNAQIDGSVRAMAAVAGRLYVGGEFVLRTGNAHLENLVCLEGGRFSTLGEGVQGTVNALALRGTDLYVGGAFTSAGYQQHNQCDWPYLSRTASIALWKDGKWSSLDQGIEGVVNDIEIQGETVYVAGSFSEGHGGTVAAWDGEQWKSLGKGLKGSVHSLASDGSGIYAGGNLSVDDKPAGVAYYNGRTWRVQGTFNVPAGSLGFHEGTLTAGGNFAASEYQPYNYLVSWDGFEWRQVNGAPKGSVTGLTRINGGYLVASQDTRAGLVFLKD